MNQATLIFLLLIASASFAQHSASLQGNVERKIDRQPQYTVKLVSFNSREMDFSPYPYKDGIVFVSSRNEKGKVNGDEQEFLNLFYTQESEDGTFLRPELLNKENTTPFHEGPTVFFDDNKRRIVTRNGFSKKGKIADGAVNPLELAQGEMNASGQWTDLVPLAFCSKEYSVAHPAISSDGGTLYFSSDMPGTLGASDLFVSRWENGTWSSPVNLGKAVNTPGQELFPFVYKDSILFFASTGHGGLGGLDLFSCDLTSQDLTVTNLGSPLNSADDDFGFFLEAKGNSGFFSSNRKGGIGADDIYYFEEVQQFVSIQLQDNITHDYVAGAGFRLFSNGVPLGETESGLNGVIEFRMSPARDYKIVVSHAKYEPFEFEWRQGKWPFTQTGHMNVSLIPLQQRIASTTPSGLQTRERTAITNTISFSSAPLDVDIVNEVPVEPVDTVMTDSVALPQLEMIVVENVNDLPSIFVVRNDSIYNFHLLSPSVLGNDSLGLKITMPFGAKRNNYERIISEQILSYGYAISRFMLIRSFFFDSEKTLVRNDASAQLDKIIDVMVTHPQIDVELVFHADSRGTENFNLELSKRRSDEVTAYLLRAGIQKERIVSQFVGESQLLNDCGDLSDCDELHHQLNRTTEFNMIVRSAKK